ncbi:unnamed protein product [Cylindrotheca closterium]|uniref:Uncharacterized protein n=1 Tax=Cylindrotheca closterium TaxID=2856 RepID=A0AAD2G5B9_9STRA|nr:unnamed protein product [Cylindrotheca closterium]
MDFQKIQLVKRIKFFCFGEPTAHSTPPLPVACASTRDTTSQSHCPAAKDGTGVKLEATVSERVHRSYFQ